MEVISLNKQEDFRYYITNCNFYMNGQLIFNKILDRSYLDSVHEQDNMLLTETFAEMCLERGIDIIEYGEVRASSNKIHIDNYKFSINGDLCYSDLINDLVKRVYFRKIAKYKMLLQ